MKLYSFELGRVTELCLAELISLFGEKNLVERVRRSVFFNLEPLGIKPSDIQKLQDKLGGTIKIAEVLDSFPLKSEEPKIKIKKSLENILTNEFKDHAGSKIIFALSTVNIPADSKVFLKFFLNFSKVFLKSLGKSSRFVNKPWQNPTPAQIYKSRAIEKGIDITILGGETNLYITKTLSIQNIDAYSYRDFDKPFRDAKMGMLPPKLAQIMINLAEPSLTHPCKTIFDPFCGSGTILMEALLQGKKAIGGDIDQVAVDGTMKNLNWLVENFANTGSDFTVSQKDAKDIGAKDLPSTPVDAIVSETHLGPSLSKPPSKELSNTIFQELTDLHGSWLPKAAKLIPEKGKIVICLPSFRISKDKYESFPNLEKILKSSGLKKISSFVYDREDQVVGREIIVTGRAQEKES